MCFIHRGKISEQRIESEHRSAMVWHLTNIVRGEGEVDVTCYSHSPRVIMLSTLILWFSSAFSFSSVPILCFQIYLLKPEEGGSKMPIAHMFKKVIYSLTWDASAEIRLPPNQDMIMPGEVSSVSYINK